MDNKLLLIAALASVSTAAVSPAAVIAAEVPETPATYVAENGGITTIKFDNGVLSPDVYLSTRALQLITWAGGGAVALVVSLIPGIGIQTAKAVVDVVQGYSGTIDNGIIIHFNYGLVTSIEGQ